MSKLYIVKHRMSTKVYRSEESFYRANSNIRPDSGDALIEVEIYDYTPSSEGTLYDIINSIKTANNRDRRIASLSNPEAKIVADVRNKFIEIMPKAYDYNKNRMLKLLDECDSIKKLKSILSGNRRYILSIENYEWYTMLLDIHNFTEYGNENELLKKARADKKSK